MTRTQRNMFPKSAQVVEAASIGAVVSVDGEIVVGLENVNGITIGFAKLNFESAGQLIDVLNRARIELIHRGGHAKAGHA